MAPDQKELKKNELDGAVSENESKSFESSVEQIKIPENFTNIDRGGESGISGNDKKPVDIGSASNSSQPISDPIYASYKKIEGILEEDLGELYNNLTPQEQKAFKIKGEQTAQSIFQLVYHKSKIKVKKIIKLISNWLSMIPGVNRYFLEQEAKIKADKIIELAEKDKIIHF